jgi:hypothetical protein
MAVKHKVTINVSDASGRKSTVLRGADMKIPARPLIPWMSEKSRKEVHTMSKVAATLDAAVAVITDIRSLADSLQVLVDAMSENTPAEKPAKASKPKKITAKEATAEPAPKEEKSLNLEDVRSVLADKSRKGHTAEVKALINKHGADKLSEIDPAEYASLLADAEVL